jgi:hypothetical protein
MDYLSRENLSEGRYIAVLDWEIVAGIREVDRMYQNLAITDHDGNVVEWIEVPNPSKVDSYVVSVYWKNDKLKACDYCGYEHDVLLGEKRTRPNGNWFK